MTIRITSLRAWVSGACVAAGLLVAPAAVAQQSTFHLDRLEMPGAPDDGLVLFRPVTQPRATFFAQIGLGGLRLHLWLFVEMDH